ncbi:MAG: helix-turn-helix domain-containing protein [Desulfobacula sp.]|jgi:transposase-like protein|nr:helix-turn-helix domain-containing protein [Desulfobacula sp.]
MKINLHKNARTTPAQRAFIQNADQMSISELADRIGVSETTIRRWKNRNFVFDKPHTPKKVRTAMTPEQEILVIILRICLRLGLDDLQQVVQEFICPDCSRSGLNRLLKRYHISRLAPFKKALPRKPAINLNDYRGTYFYYNKVILPPMPGTRTPVHVQTLDYSFKYFYADICRAPKPPALFFIKQAIHHFLLHVMGIIFTDPIVLFDSDMLIRQSVHLHNQLIKNYCQGHNLIPWYLKTVPGPTLERLKQTTVSIEKRYHLPKINLPCFDNASLLKNIWMYNTKISLTALKNNTPKQAIQKYYAHFPNSFKKNPNQSFGTSLPPQNTDQELVSFLFVH